MVASYGETSGFSTVNVEELMFVNGGKGSSSSSSSSVPNTHVIIANVPKPDGFSPIINIKDPGVSYKNGNTTVSVTAHIDYSNSSPKVTSATITVNHGISK
jgi:hypothetical protein